MEVRIEYQVVVVVRVKSFEETSVMDIVLEGVSLEDWDDLAPALERIAIVDAKLKFLEKRRKEKEDV